MVPLGILLQATCSVTLVGIPAALPPRNAPLTPLLCLVLFQAWVPLLPWPDFLPQPLVTFLWTEGMEK